MCPNLCTFMTTSWLNKIHFVHSYLIRLKTHWKLITILSFWKCAWTKLNLAWTSFLSRSPLSLITRFSSKKFITILPTTRQMFRSYLRLCIHRSWLDVCSSHILLFCALFCVIYLVGAHANVKVSIESYKKKSQFRFSIVLLSQVHVPHCCLCNENLLWTKATSSFIQVFWKANAHDLWNMKYRPGTIHRTLPCIETLPLPLTLLIEFAYRLTI